MPEYGAVKGWNNRIRIGVSSALNESIWKAGRDPLLNSFTTETGVDIDKISVIGSRLPVSIVEGVKDVTGSLERNLYSKNTTYNEFIYVNDSTHYDLLKATGLGGTEGLECKILWNPISNSPDDPYNHIITNVKFHNYRVAHSARDIVVESVDFDGSQLGLPGKKKLTIVGTNVALSDYQLKIELPLSGFDINRKIFGPDDICFTDEYGTIIPHWVESWQIDKAIIWCKVPYIPASASTYIWLHYGDPFIYSESSISDTFIRVVDGLISCWHFDEGFGTVAHDTGGSNNNGMISGASWIDGKFGKALNFSGYDYVDCGNDASLNITDKITLEVWVKKGADLGNLNHWIFGKSAANAIHGYALYYGYGTDFYFCLGDGTNYHQTEYYIPSNPGQWHHFVGTYDGSQQKLYDNSNLVRTLEWTGAIDPGTSNVKIGYFGNWDRFNGVIDEVRIYNRDLIEDEISDLYNYYGYTTLNYPGKVLVRKYVFPEPSVII